MKAPERSKQRNALIFTTSSLYPPSFHQPPPNRLKSLTSTKRPHSPPSTMPLPTTLSSPTIRATTTLFPSAVRVEPNRLLNDSFFLFAVNRTQNSLLTADSKDWKIFASWELGRGGGGGGTWHLGDGAVNGVFVMSSFCQHSLFSNKLKRWFLKHVAS